MRTVAAPAIRVMYATSANSSFMSLVACQTCQTTQALCWSIGAEAHDVQYSTDNMCNVAAPLSRHTKISLDRCQTGHTSQPPHSTGSVAKRHRRYVVALMSSMAQTYISPADSLGYLRQVRQACQAEQTMLREGDDVAGLRI